MTQTLARRIVATTLFVLALPIASFSQPAPKPGPEARAFASPEEAVKALIQAARKSSLEELLALLGPEGQTLAAASDPVAARQNRQVFVVAAAEKWQLVDEEGNRKRLVIGNEEWPFPVPLAKAANGWRWDAAAGLDEVIARRIGRNELAAIATAQAYVTAQQRYAQEAHDGRPAGLYAMKFRSDQGTQNGLYWPSGKGEKRSPLGDLVAQAAEEGQTLDAAKAEQSALHGYYFKILTAQGSAAPGGRKNYVANGRMSGGFALVAWPAQYDVTGVMTFIVNQDGIVYERDLGPASAAEARKLTAYNPDRGWTRVSP